MRFRISHEILNKLESSKAWQSATSFNSMFTPESIYGPKGKLSWLWRSSWDSEEEMNKDLYSNMGGGVPLEIINELIRITISSSLD